MSVLTYFKFLPKFDVRCIAVNYTGDTVKFSFSTQYICPTFHILFFSVCIKKSQLGIYTSDSFLLCGSIEKIPQHFDVLSTLSLIVHNTAEGLMCL